METIIVEIILGLTGDCFDFMLPAHLPVRSIVHEIIWKIEQYQGSLMIDKKNPILLNQENMSVLSIEKSLYSSGLRDGSRLMIV